MMDHTHTLPLIWDSSDLRQLCARPKANLVSDPSLSKGHFKVLLRGLFHAYVSGNAKTMARERGLYSTFPVNRNHFLITAIIFRSEEMIPDNRNYISR